MIVCGSGRSLTTVPFRTPGFPLAAISTAIRMVREPDHWILVDNVQPAHGKEGKLAAADPKIHKVIPKDREGCYRGFPNVELVRREHPGKKTGREFLDGGPGVVTGQIQRSMLFGIQWLVKHYNVLIFAGVDLRADPTQPWGHDFFPTQKNRVNSMNHNLGLEYQQLKQWAPIARARGIRWLAWTPNSPIEGFMDPFEMESEEWKSTTLSTSSAG